MTDDSDVCTDGMYQKLQFHALAQGIAIGIAIGTGVGFLHSLGPLIALIGAVVIATGNYIREKQVRSRYTEPDPGGEG